MIGRFSPLSSSSAGPRLFLSCPMDVEGSQVWFTDLWNYSIIPYMLEAVREGLQVKTHFDSLLFSVPFLIILNNLITTL